jgi:hypothetical protein
MSYHFFERPQQYLVFRVLDSWIFENMEPTMGWILSGLHDQVYPID